jgi:HK97 family phage portal protein
MGSKWLGLKNIFKEQKSVPDVGAVGEQTRDGRYKSFIPGFLYKPPFGYPRYTDIPNIRRLAATPFVEMCITTIIDEICAIDWEITKIDEEDEITEQDEKRLDHVRNLFYNPNTNKENFEIILKKLLRDILELDSGVLEKAFNRAGQMVEFVARDGGTFTKNPDLHGMLTEREDFIEGIYIMNEEQQKEMGLHARVEPNWISPQDAREKAAYFQYGWVTGARPIPFGKREIVWFEKNPRTDSLYGRGPVEVLNEVIQTLIYSIENNLDYFNNNSIPKGIIGLEGANKDEIDEFSKHWKEKQRTKDSAGNWKKIFHHIPIIGGKLPKFERIQFSNAELELITQQKWFSHIVWMCFGVTPSELGFTEDTSNATEIVQSKVFRRKAIYPLLRLLEYKFNSEIISEFEYEDIKFKFVIFDTEEEKKKYELYDLQVKSGIMTINEIRRREGYDEVEWGDQAPREWQSSENSFNFGFGNTGENSPFNQGDGETLEENQEERVDQKAEKAEEKAMVSESNPLVLGEFETPDESKLEMGMIYLIDRYENEIKELIEREYGSKLNEIKGLDFTKKVKDIISLASLKTLTNQVIKYTFTKGWEKQERQINRNFIPDQEAINFIQDYTFENIQNLEEEMANDLRAELERGIMNGEGIQKLTNRVKDVMKISKNRAEMIARTETNRAENYGTLQVMKNVADDYDKEWVASMDNRTSQICKDLNGKVIGINEKFKDPKTGDEFLCPPAHVNCRSSLIYMPKEVRAKKEQEKKARELELKEIEYDKIVEKDIDLKLKEKEAELKKRKEELLKKLETC